jgi:translation initiation factor IF-3
LSRPFSPRTPSFSGPRINGKIRAREVRVIGEDGKQLGIISLNEALGLARQQGVDLVEIAPTAQPPVCRIVDFGKYRYEQAKREKESKKNQHVGKVKEVQLSPKIDPHDLGVKLNHAIAFLCDDMKVKISLRFRGREMAHTEIGHQVVNKFLADVAPWGHPDRPPLLQGRSINVMISPLPRNKRAKLPEALAGQPLPPDEVLETDDETDEDNSKPQESPAAAVPPPAVKPGQPDTNVLPLATPPPPPGGAGSQPFNGIQMS